MSSEIQRFGFIRVEAKNAKQTQDLIAEADRRPGFCSHIPEPEWPELPERPRWLVGGAESIARDMAAYMATPLRYRRQNSIETKRKQRRDARCCINLVASFPGRSADIIASGRRKIPELTQWLEVLAAFLKKKFRAKISGMVLHLDEEYAHVHVFYIGNPRELHPGIRAEYRDGTRLLNGKDRSKLHRAGLSEFLDEYYAEVGCKFGHARKGSKRVIPRIKSRAAYFAAKLLAELKEVDSQLPKHLVMLEKLAREVTGGPRSLNDYPGKPAPDRSVAGPNSEDDDDQDTSPVVDRPRS